MNPKAAISILLSVVLIFSISISGPGCANIVPPQGGPRDSLPPQLEKADPRDSAIHFTGNKISFTFDEYVDAQNAQQELLVSPTPGINPTVEYRLKTVTVRLKDTLDANTTYILNFGNGIRDYNEGNVLKGFTYIFSTGATIDSFEIHGRVLLAETGTTDSTLIVMLHKSASDSAVIKEKPRYIAKLDGNGNFVFKNLPSGTFYLYALRDDGGTHRYLDRKQLFAFADKPVLTSKKNDVTTLYAFGNDEEKKQVVAIPVLRKGIRETEDKRLKWLTNLTGNQLGLQEDLIISFEQPVRVFDSSKTRLTADSSFTPIDSTLFTKDSTGRKIRFSCSWKENTAYHLVLEKEFAEDSSGRKLLKTDTLNFRTRSKSDYGTVLLHFRNLDPGKNPVLLFIQGGEVRKSYPLSSADFSQSLFLPGEYQLRILNDGNRNGKWDPGDFFGRHKQPEIVTPIDRRITVKPAIENEFEIAL